MPANEHQTQAGKGNDRMQKRPQPTEHPRHTIAGQIILPGTHPYEGPSMERIAFVGGLFTELQHQLHRHLSLVDQMVRLDAQISITERNLAATRDHLLASMESTDEEVPEDWKEVLNQVRFVGARLGDACIEVLREYGRPMTLKEIEIGLNKGQFRFRSGSPLREINAALLRQPRTLVRKNEDTWEFVREAAEKDAAFTGPEARDRSLRVAG
jgi:hypothetical protein